MNDRYLCKAKQTNLFKYVQNGNRVEVIGSAIDNPELLEVGECREAREKQKEREKQFVKL